MKTKEAESNDTCKCLGLIYSYARTEKPNYEKTFKWYKEEIALVKNLCSVDY